MERRAKAPSNGAHSKNIELVIQWKNCITYLQLQKGKMDKKVAAVPSKFIEK